MRRFWSAFLRLAARKHLQQYENGRCIPSVRAVFLADYVSRKVIVDGAYERAELDALSRKLFYRIPCNSTALDIGANIGNHAIQFAKHFDRVIAFEPNPMVASVLRANTMETRNAIEVIEIGLSDAPGRLSFEINNRNLGSSRIIDGPSRDTIEVTTLDALVGPLNLNNVRFVKIDVEGHEDKVIAGAANLLSTSHPIIAMEGFYKTDPEKGLRVSALLDQFGYTNFYRLTDPRHFVLRTLRSATPKPLRKARVLTLERIEHISGEDHPLAIASAEPLQ